MKADPFDNNRTASPASNWDNPQSAGAASELKEAEQFCRQIAVRHYENFIVASVFLPRRLRQPFYNVYAYCRIADDLADQSPSAEIALQKLAEWRQWLSDCFAGRASHPVFIALSKTVQQFNLRARPFVDLLDAFTQDQQVNRYANMAQLLDYCQRSANPVGRIVLRLADADQDPVNLSLSDSVCTGLQLANHWQDVARDLANNNRIYLPAEDAARYQVNLDDLQAPAQRQSFCRLIEFECQQAQELLCRGLTLADRVPDWLAKDIRLFVHGGLATLQAIRNVGWDVLQTRPTVTKRKQFQLICSAALGRLKSS